MNKGYGGIHLTSPKIDWDKIKPVDTDPTQMLPDLSVTCRMDVEEFQDRFIFQTIQPFCNDIAGFEVSKTELAEAMQLLRTMKKCKAIYGADLYATNVDNATYISAQCEKAYQSGHEAGTNDMKEKMKELIFPF